MLNFQQILGIWFIIIQQCIPYKFQAKMGIELNVYTFYDSTLYPILNFYAYQTFTVVQKSNVKNS